MSGDVEVITNHESTAVELEQMGRLLDNGRPSRTARNGIAATVLPANLPVPRHNRRQSGGSILSSFRFNNTGRISGHVFSRYRQSRFNARRIRKRVVFKHGDCNVVQSNVPKLRRRYLQDIFTTLVDAQWRWTLLVFSLNFLLSWLGFACIWYLVCYLHGDLDDENINSDTWIPCVTGIHSFMSSFLFSVETQHTIGYGGRLPTEKCSVAVSILCMQSITGVMIQAFMVGVVLAKLSRPKKRTQTLLFSRSAVICHRDGVPCLMFRVGDMRKSHIIEAHVRAQLIKQKYTKEGECIPFYQTELKVGGDGEEDKIFFIWPTTIVHKIDETSPLYSMTATDLLRERFEIVVILEGVIESTGMTTQARSSYLPSEILWGHRFKQMVSFKAASGEYEVDYALFNHTIEVDTPLISAQQLDEAGLIEESLNKLRHPTPRFQSFSSHTSILNLDLDQHLEIEIPDCSISKSPQPVTLKQEVATDCSVHCQCSINIDPLEDPQDPSILYCY